MNKTYNEYIFKIESYETELTDKNEYYLLILSSIVCPLIKLTYIGSIIFPIVATIYSKENI